MMYFNNLVASIKVNGKVLREQNGKVYIPFGSEYTIILKNLSTVRAKAKVEIDGSTAVDWVVLQPNQRVEFERYFRGNMSEGNKFKFIERTEEIERNRGIKVEDGLVRVEYEFEKKTWNTFTTLTPPYTTWPSYCQNSDYTIGGIHLNSVKSTASPTRSLGNNVQASMAMNCATADAGITVPGSHSNQQFTYTSDFVTGEASAIVLQLVGAVSVDMNPTRYVPIKKAITVQSKAKCITCGRTNKSSAKFCGNCGTSLRIY